MKNKKIFFNQASIGMIALLFLLFTFSIQPARATEFPFYDDFENGLGNWITSWSLTESDSFSPTNSAADSPDVNYPPNSNASLTLATPIDLSTTVFPVLTFWQKIGVYSADYGYLEISEDGGFTWSILLDYTNTWRSTWEYVQVDLSAYKATPIKIRFRLRANGSSETWGWDVDDVEIKEKDTETMAFPFSDDFESGLVNWLTSWSLTESDSFSPTNSAADSPDANYPPNASTGMTLLHPIDLSTTVSPVLTFWQKIGVYSADYGYLEISEDGGFTWSILLDYTNTWRSTWEYVQVDLSAYKATPIKIRFRLRANGSSETWGWDVDDVEIREKDIQTTPFPFCDDYESVGRLDNWLTSWSLTESDSFSPTNSAADSPDANYPPNASTGMTLLHPIDLSATVSPVLTFWQKIGVYSADYGYLEISEDGGFTWSILLDYTNTWRSTWEYVQVDLSAYKATPIKIRFRLRANGSSETWGWNVDDVEIRELFGSCNVPPEITSFATDITSGDPPLTVSFTCDAYDPDGFIAAYHWDFDGNGVIDEVTSGGPSSSTTFTYTDCGNYNATCTAVDDLGAMSTVSDPIAIKVCLFGGLDIRANSSNGPLSVTTTDPVDITVGLNPDARAGDVADYWVGALTPYGTYWYDYDGLGDWVKSDIPESAGQYPMGFLPYRSVQNTTLDEGLYTYFFILDDNPDGIFEITWLDYVVIVSSDTAVSQTDLSIDDDYEADLRKKLNELINK